MAENTALWEYLYVEGDPPLELHRVYYNEDGSLRTHMPLITVAGNDPKAMLVQVEAMLEACKKPVLDANDFPEALEPLPNTTGGFSFTLKTRRREQPPPERKTPELRIVGKDDKGGDPED